jgi:hypothetical protein
MNNALLLAPAEGSSDVPLRESGFDTHRTADFDNRNIGTSFKPAPRFDEVLISDVMTCTVQQSRLPQRLKDLAGREVVLVFFIRVSMKRLIAPNPGQFRAPSSVTKTPPCWKVTWFPGRYSTGPALRG